MLSASLYTSLARHSTFRPEEKRRSICPTLPPFGSHGDQVQRVGAVLRKRRLIVYRSLFTT